MLVIVFLLLFLLTKEIDIDLKLYRFSQSYSVYTDFYIDNDFFYYVPISLGTPFQDFNLLYDTSFPHIMVNPVKEFLQKEKNKTHYFIKSNSSSLIEGQQLQILDYTGTSVSDTGKIIDQVFTLNWVHGQNVTGERSLFEGVFGLGMKYNNDSNSIYNLKYSLIDTLYSDKIIKKRIFGHKYFHDRKYMRLYLGEITDESFKGDYPKCYSKHTSESLKKINPFLEYVWSCGLNSVSVVIDNGKGKEEEVVIDNMNQNVVFSTGTNTITGPLEEGEKIINLILEKDYGKNCKKNTLMSGVVSLLCRWKTDIYDFPKIKFNIGERSGINKGIDLYLENNNIFFKEFEIAAERYIYRARFQFVPNMTYWVLGQSVLREYDMIFDMDDQSVGFWNLEKKAKHTKKIFIFCLIAIVGTLIAIGVIYWCKYLRENSEEKLKEKSFYSKIEKMQEIAVLS